MAKKNLLTLVGVGYIILLTYGSLFDTKDLLEINFKFHDKLIHFAAYALLCLVVYVIFKIYDVKNSLRTAVLFSIIFGTVIEILQMTLTSYRAFDCYDIAANTAGIFIMACAIHTKKAFIINKLETFM
ncbi:MAG: VanZ family protein [Bacteroidota bacterium]|nr:VanZ family protein [Bacteroidota bacterium]